MRNLFVQFDDGTRRVNWPATFGFAIVTYTGVIAASEIFWKLFAGGFSSLIALYAFFTATLIVVRVIGTALADPFVPYDNGLRST